MKKLKNLHTYKGSVSNFWITFLSKWIWRRKKQLVTSVLYRYVYVICIWRCRKLNKDNAMRFLSVKSRRVCSFDVYWESIAYLQQIKWIYLLYNCIILAIICQIFILPRICVKTFEVYLVLQVMLDIINKRIDKDKPNHYDGYDDDSIEHAWTVLWNYTGSIYSYLPFFCLQISLKRKR